MPILSIAIKKKASHLSGSAADVFSSIMPTCGNGELCGKLLHNATNRAHLGRLKFHCSKAKKSIRPVRQQRITLRRMVSTSRRSLLLVTWCETCLIRHGASQRTIGISVIAIGMLAKCRLSNAVGSLLGIMPLNQSRIAKSLSALKQLGRSVQRQERQQLWHQHPARKPKTSPMPRNSW